jgi:hypothetical protein
MSELRNLPAAAAAAAAAAAVFAAALAVAVPGVAVPGAPASVAPAAAPVSAAAGPLPGCQTRAGCHPAALHPLRRLQRLLLQPPAAQHGRTPRSHPRSQGRMSHPRCHDVARLPAGALPPLLLRQPPPLPAAAAAGWWRRHPRRRRWRQWPTNQQLPPGYRMPAQPAGGRGGGHAPARGGGGLSLFQVWKAASPQVRPQHLYAPPPPANAMPGRTSAHRLRGKPIPSKTSTAARCSALKCTAAATATAAAAPASGEARVPAPPLIPAGEPEAAPRPWDDPWPPPPPPPAAASLSQSASSASLSVAACGGGWEGGGGGGCGAMLRAGRRGLGGGGGGGALSDCVHTCIFPRALGCRLTRPLPPSPFPPP